jgi:heptosyltransferase I
VTVEQAMPFPGGSLLVVRLGAMGDVIHTLAAVTALRDACPNLQIGWVVEQRWAELLCSRDTPRCGPRSPQRPLLDFVHVVNTKRWRKSPLASAVTGEWLNSLRSIRARHYQIAADFQGAIKSALIAGLAKAQTTVGLETPREAPARWLYANRIRVAGTHVVDQYRSLAEALAGTPLLYHAPVFPRDEEAESGVAKKFCPEQRDFVLINPGAGWRAKQWPATGYGEVARALSKYGLAALVNFGPGEQELALKVHSASGGVAEPVSCTIPELIALTRRAKLFIGGDTGPLHLAAALRVPVVGIFGPTDPARNGPYGTNSWVLRDSASKTSLSHADTLDPGLLNIAPEQVISASHRLLERARG